MMGQTDNRQQCVVRGRFATPRKRAYARQMALASFLSSALIGGIPGDFVIASDDLQATLPTAEAKSSGRSGHDGANQASEDLARRASEFGQRMRDRFFKAPTTVSPVVQAAGAMESEPLASDTTNSAETSIATATSIKPLETPPGTRSTDSGSSSVSSHPAKSTKVSTSKPSEKRNSVWQSPVYLRPRAIAKSVQPNPEPEASKPEIAKPEITQPEIAKPEIAATLAKRPERPDPASSPTSSLQQFEIQLQRKFPTSAVRLQWSQSSLVVSGTVDDAHQAIQLMAFIRESYLVPVVDRLEVPRGNGRGSR